MMCHIWIRLLLRWRRDRQGFSMSCFRLPFIIGFLYRSWESFAKSTGFLMYSRECSRDIQGFSICRVRVGLLREAYNGEELIDRDPLLEIRDKFVELLDEWQQQRAAQREELGIDGRKKQRIELPQTRDRNTKLLNCLNEARLVKSSKNMDGAMIALKLPMLAVVLLVLYPMTKGQWAPVIPPPLCASQFALVNHACSKLPYMPVPPPSPPSPPLPPPNPPSPDGSGSRRHSSHGHRHRGHRHRETPIEEECCRWVKEVDSVCVCELLVHLPPFLIKLLHNYTVTVDETCSVTFECSSSLLPV